MVGAEAGERARVNTTKRLAYCWAFLVEATRNVEGGNIRDEHSEWLGIHELGVMNRELGSCMGLVCVSSVYF